MKFPLSWLKEWVDPKLEAETLAERLTVAGLEVDSVVSEGGGLDGVSVAEVVEAGQHPNADRLSLCRVDYGSGETVDVVCGAPNVRVGMKTPLARPGTRLPNGLKLRKSKIRGVVSNGMLCSAEELGLGSESDGILELPDDAPVGASLTEVLGLPDSLFDVDITPNRGDCFSVLGIARDAAALTGQAVSGPRFTAPKATIDAEHPVERPEPDACPRFAHRVVRGIDPKGRSPLWLTERLRRSGLRAIHPVVDVTNYVMLELGQPLHAYDLNKLNGPVRPRYAAPGERVTLLDEREVAPSERTVVISDDSGAIGLAGIMGGLSTMVTDETTDVFFEGAFWPPAVMAGRARALGMHTDASLRFERGVDPEGQARAVDRAVELLLEICGGEAGPLRDDVDEDRLPKRKPVALTGARLRQVLGCEIPAKKVTEILTHLGFVVTESEHDWSVAVPSHRFDIAIEDDLVEEVARVYGYDRIPEATATLRMPLSAVPETAVDAATVADTLVARGYHEVITYSFVDKALDETISGGTNELALSNPISSEMSVMRGSLWTGMLQTAASNLARQRERVRIFEIGNSYHGTLDAPREVQRVAGLVVGAVRDEHWSEKPQNTDFYDVKADIEALFEVAGWADVARFNAATHPALQPGQTAELLRDDQRVGWFGKLHPRIARAFELKSGAIYAFELDVDAAFATHVPTAESISKFPAVRRDVAFVVDDDVIAADVLSAVRRASPELIRDVKIFDVYRGKSIEAGRKSIALGLILQETSRTLVDVDADAVVDAAVQIIIQEFDAELRD